MCAGVVSVESDPNLGAEKLDVSPSGALPNLNVDDDGAGAPPKEKTPGAGAGAGVDALVPKAGAGASFEGCEPKVVGAVAGAEPPKENAGVEAGAEDVLPPKDGAEEFPSSLPRRLLLRSSFDDSSPGILPRGTIGLVSFGEEGCCPNLNDDAGAASAACAGVPPKLKPDGALDPLPPKDKDALLDEVSSEALLAELGTLIFPPFSGRVRLLVGSVAGTGRSGSLPGGVDDEGKTKLDFGASSLFFSSPDTVNLKGLFSPFVGAGVGADANVKPTGFVASLLSEPFDSVAAAGAGALPNENAGALPPFPDEALFELPNKEGVEEETPSLAVELESLAGPAAADEAAGAAPKLNPPALGVVADDELPPPKLKPPVVGADAEGAGVLPKEKAPVAGAGVDDPPPKENPSAPMMA
jgi:hypothetical protein